MQREFIDLHQPDLYFGQGWIPGENNFYPDLRPEQKIFILGMLDACPEPQKMINSFSLKWIIDRYTECNLVGSFILAKAHELNPPLALQLVTKRPREDGEVPHDFEPEAVPSDYQENLYHGSAVAGYSASRILIEQFGREKPWEIGNERTQEGFYILESALQRSKSPIEFIVILAQLVSKNKANPNAVLGHLLAVELQNEGIISQIREIGKKLQVLAPELWNHYLALTPQERESFGILPLELVA
jgi:hypothetical protein